MRNKNNIFLIVLIIMALAIPFLGIYMGKYWYYHPRNITFELAMELPIPNESFDYSDWLSYNYVSDEDQLMYWMVIWYNQRPKNNRFYKAGYDSCYVECISKQLNFKKYDYIIVYQKRLNSLDHSPNLTKQRDGLYYDNRIPLIPTFDTLVTDKVYIYQIKKNKKYRAPGP